jgi:hypothetical protein
MKGYACPFCNVHFKKPKLLFMHVYDHHLPEYTGTPQWGSRSGWKQCVCGMPCRGTMGFHQHVCTSDGPGHYHRQSSAFTHSHIKRLLLHMHLNLHGGMS